MCLFAMHVIENKNRFCTKRNAMAAGRVHLKQNRKEKNMTEKSVKTEQVEKDAVCVKLSMLYWKIEFRMDLRSGQTKRFTESSQSEACRARSLFSHRGVTRRGDSILRRFPTPPSVRIQHA